MMVMIFSQGKYADNQADKGTPAAFVKQDKELAMKVEKFVDLKKNWASQTWSQRRKGK